MDLASFAPRSEHAQPTPPDGERGPQVEVSMVERTDGTLRLARVAAIIAADRERLAKVRAA